MHKEDQSPVIDGLVITHLPAGLGAASDFEFEWGDVRFVQRVWETEIELGVWRVDLQIQAMRSPKLTDPAALRDFLVGYHEKDDTWATEPLGADGFIGEREAFKLLSKGLAAEVRDPFNRQGMETVKQTLDSIHPK
ncbi:hypothetical protein [Glycomyces buryatensis]|uniref:Uncharacterized protein n=1 Tax=Glycomyces buryatensis TaxID=2570927 RepID=A0A4S8QIJ7_9ACTN|nr:hypothetical protein [Glycomyces buryatensis]THV43082.1 hypothetical protein FAB82_02270 [Glycomyces buryatensis]